MASDLASASALGLARLVRERAVSSEELVRTFLDRIAAYDTDGSIFVQVLGRSALRDARQKDAFLAKASPDELNELPSFFGVPTAIKDLNLVRGAFTRLGSRAFTWLWSPVDDVVTANIRRGGFVILGKLSTSELGALPATEPEIHPPTRNPWNRDHTAGGSSGGTGAALAARLVPIAQGSDGAGSIRIPSSFCHLFGFKPSRGRIDNPGRTPQLATSGPMGHSVEDVAAMLDVMAVTSHAPRTYRQLAFERPPPLRVKLTLSSPLVTATGEIADATLRAGRALGELGHIVEEVPSGPDGTLEEFLPLWQFIVGRVPVLIKGQLQPITRWLHETGRRIDPQLVVDRHRMLEERIEAWFGDADVVVTPTVAEPPPVIGAWKALPPDAGFAQAARLGAFTALFNITGQPAASVPAAVGSNGLPIGVQIVGRRGKDEQVLAVCKQLEDLLPWAARDLEV